MKQQQPKQKRQSQRESSAKRGNRSEPSSAEGGVSGRRSWGRGPHGRLPSVALLGFACVLGLGTVLSSCERQERGGTSASERQDPPGLSVPFDIGVVMRRVHFAWRSEEGGFSTGHSTHAAHASAHGEWTFTPFHHSPELGLLQGDPLRLQTSSLARGGRLLPSPGGAGVSEDGSLAMARGPVVERLRNAEEGVQQSWMFARRPSGTGSLTVRQQVEGLPFVGETALGVHFADPRGLGVRYGAAEWTDASGVRTSVPVRYEAGQVVMEVPAEVVEAAAYPASLSPLISPEFGMDTPVSSPVVRIQAIPDIGFDGQNFLVVWHDSRGSNGVPEVYDIFGARVSPTGTVLDPSGFVISGALGDQKSPAVGFDGQQYLVTWQDSRSGSPRIHASRVTRAGAVLDPGGIRLNEGTGAQTWPTLAFDGQNFLVAWQDFRSTTTDADIWGTRVSPSGTVLDPDGLVISSQPFSQAVPDMAFDGQNYFLVWQDQRAGGGGHVFGGRVSPSGAVLDGPGFAVSTPISVELAPAVAFDGRNYLVVWQDDRSGTLSYDIYGTRVSPSGAVLDGSGFAIVARSQRQQAPALVFDGQNYLVTWEDGRSDSALDIYGARVSPERVVSSSFAISTGTGAQLTPTVVSGGGITIVAWSDARAGSASDIYGTRLDLSGGPMEPTGLRISSSANSQLAPAVASSGQDYLVVWQDDRGGAYDIYGVRVRENGTVLDPTGVAISTAANNQSSPVAVYDGQGYFVAWQDQRNGNADIYGARVSTAGQVRDPAGIAISARAGSQNRPAIATSGQSHLVVWYDDRANFSPDIYGARVGADGTVVDPAGFAISSATGSQLVPAVAYDGQNYLVVWHDFRNGGTADIYGARVTASGTVLEPTGLPIAVVPGSQTSVAIAFGGSGYFVTWRELRNPTADVYGARVLPDGAVLDPGGLPVSNHALDEETFPTVAYDGQDYVVVWQQAQGSGPNNLHGARVTQEGAVVDPGGFPIAVDPSDELAPRLSAGSAGHLLLVYQRMDVQAPYGTQRVRARLLTTYGEPPDAGTPDSGTPDSGSPDAGAPDSGSPDAGEPDAGIPDGGVPDAGEVDGGLPDAGAVDAGISDAGAPDSGISDAGAPELDAGFPDAGTPEPDAGLPDAGAPEQDAGLLDAGTPELDAGFPDAGSTEPDAGTADAGSPELDAGTLDGGGSDPGTPDGGRVDAGMPEEEEPDAGPLDSGVPDGGEADAGAPDAGALDSGIPDTGTPDAGATDAGEPDSGQPDPVIPDAGGPDDGKPNPPGDEPGGCGCTGGGSSSGLFFGGLLIVLARRRRRSFGEPAKPV
jgi:hypothetical protein